MALSIAVVALANYLGTEIRLMKYHLARAQASAWARAGMYLAMQRLALDAQTPGEPYDWLGDDWAVFPQDDPTTWLVPFPPHSDETLLRGQVAIQMTDEERKLELNAASLEVLTRLTNNAVVAQAIVDYRDPDTDGSYEGEPTAQPPYVAKNAPLTMIEELAEIPQVSAEPLAKETLEQEGSASGHATININTASPEVLKSLVGDVENHAELMSLIDTLVNSRAGIDGQFGTDDDCKVTALNPSAFQPDVCGDQIDDLLLASLLSLLNPSASSSVFRVVVVGTVENPTVRYPIEAIVRRVGEEEAGDKPTVRVSGQAFQILAWKEG